MANEGSFTRDWIIWTNLFKVLFCFLCCLLIKSALESKKYISWKNLLIAIERNEKVDKMFQLETSDKK